MAKYGNSTPLPFEKTHLWRNAFSKRAYDSDICAFYAGHLRDLREKARALVDRIRTDIPYFTVHDVTHLDALWEIGSVIAGSSYPLTPAEGYVFGAAILLHDAAMCLAAYPTGISEITATPEWNDAVAMLMADSQDADTHSPDKRDPQKEIVERAVPIVLRLLHTRQAEELPRTKWLNALGDSEYLIDNVDLREFYGRMIGRIARSHGETMSWIHSEIGPPLGALASHDGGEVNGLKVACLLRVADACHIDARRAPRFERALIKPKGISEAHWAAQGKIAKPRVEGDAVVYTTGSPFSLSEADAWWLCFDAVRVADRELRDVDVALEDTSQLRLRARRVRGAEAPRDLSRDIRTDGWDPIDTRLKVSDVPHLVQMFGGERLYGQDKRAAIRELIQNAADAIRARRRLQEGFADAFDGEVVVRLTEREGEYWIDVEDNGVGMSERTITGTLLDFGRSFWTTDAVRTEFPGLMAKGMSPTGKFGIGFFSVFMLGDVVKVTSRRYDAASSDTRTLEFRLGLSLRPILRNASADELISNGGTRVSVLLSHSPYKENGLLAKDYSEYDAQQSLGATVAALCPSLDVGLSVVERGRRSRVVNSDDWRRVDGSKLLVRVDPSRNREEVSHYAGNLRPVASGRAVYGRACIRADASWYHGGRITVGGFAAERLEFVEGILIGKTDVLARNTASLLAPPLALARWAEEQADVIARSKIPLEEQLIAAGVVIACGGNPRKLPVARLGGHYLTQRLLDNTIKGMSSITVVSGEPSFDEDRDDCHPREFKSSFRMGPEVVFLGEVPGTSYKKFWWPGEPSYRSILISIIKRRWKKYEVRDEVDIPVGRVGDLEILREAEIFTKKP